MTGVGADGDGLVDPARFPCRAFDLDTEAIRGSAGELRAYAAGLVERLDDVGARWVGLAPHYVAPEAVRVLGLVGPARTDANLVADVYEAVAYRVERYADELECIRPRLARVEERAWAFRSDVKDGVQTSQTEAVTWGQAAAPVGVAGQGTGMVSWREHGPSVAKNAGLLREHAMLLEQITMTAESAANGIRRCHDGTTAYPTGGGLLGSTVFVSAAYGGDGPAVPPDVDNSTLRDILNDIYVDPKKNPNPVGDGKVATALLNEIKTGKKTGGRWHAVDSADQLNRLVNLLEEDRKPNRAVSLSRGDRAVALREAGELWRALNSPVSKDSPCTGSSLIIRRLGMFWPEPRGTC